MKKILSNSFFLLIIGFSFFYTDKIVKLARKVDPIMIKINNAKKYVKVNNVSPIIKNEEYIAGASGCVIDENKSYNKMKQVGKYDEDLLVMKESNNGVNRKNKYIIGANKNEKKMSVILLVNKKVNNSLLEYIKEKKISINFFVDGVFLENNLNYIKNLSKYGNIYNAGRKSNYSEKYIVYDNNLVESMSHNKSKYCITKSKNKNRLKLCNDYGMEVIKPIYINENDTLEKNLVNGSILVINEDDISKTKLKIGYILSKGYEIEKLDELLNESIKCN